MMVAVITARLAAPNFIFRMGCWGTFIRLWFCLSYRLTKTIKTYLGRI